MRSWVEEIVMGVTRAGKRDVSYVATMRKGGLEPPRPKPRDPKSRAYANSATFARFQGCCKDNRARRKGSTTGEGGGGPKREGAGGRIGPPPPVPSPARG